MSTNQAVKTYAQAILSTALEDWLEALRAVERNLRRNPDILPVLDDHNAEASAKEEKLRQVLPGDVSQEVHNFLRLLVRQSDVHLLEDVIIDLQDILEEAGTVAHTARVTTAVKLSPEERNTLEERLMRQHGENLIFEYDVDPSIIGGVRVRIGDHLIDGSVSGRLSALRERLVQ